MKDIARQLTLTRLEMRHRMEGKYLLELAEPGMWPETKFTLTLTVEDMIRFDLDPSEDLVGATLDVTLKPVPYPQKAPAPPGTVIITRLLRSSEVQQNYHVPSIIVEARSVSGNRKACEAACESLSREAAALFKGVRFDHLLWSIEQMED